MRRILGLVGGDRLDGVTLSDRVDAVVLHPVLGPLILAVILFLVFQAVFAWAQVPMDAIKLGVAGFGNWLGAALPTSLLKDLAINGVLAGCRQRAGVPAANHHPVLLHPDARGLRVSAPCRIPARPGDG